MRQESVRFPSGKLSLEGALAVPEGKTPFPAVIICHPHPLYGGSMDNNVVHALSQALVRASIASFKFNFRGVGQSQGEFGQGMGEQEDVAAAISFLIKVKEVDHNRIGLVGYSAGAAFAFPVATEDLRVKAIAAVSPPLSTFDFDCLRNCSKPKLFILGTRDDFTSAHQFQKFCQSLPEPKQCETVEGADHFWWGYESKLAAKVIAFFGKVL